MTGPGWTPASGAGRRLLIVDDDAAVLRGLSDYFERLQYEVIRAETGKQAIAAYRSHRPHLVVLDLKLPDIDGLQVLEALRQFRAVVVLLTGYGDIPTAVRAMQLGAENFLTKPVDLSHLVVTIERGLEKADLRQENVRLRELIPTTGRRLMQAAALVVVALAALLLGRAIGGMAPEQAQPAQIAPPTQLPQSAPERTIDSMLRVPSAIPDSPAARRAPARP